VLTFTYLDSPFHAVYHTLSKGAEQQRQERVDVQRFRENTHRVRATEFAPLKKSTAEKPTETREEHDQRMQQPPTTFPLPCTDQKPLDVASCMR
jgi:hypothetical protein